MFEVVHGLCVDSFESAGHLTGRQRTYDAVKDAVLSAGRFSVFEATQNERNAKLFSDLCNDPEVEIFNLGYPWTGVRKAVEDDETKAT